MYLRLQLLIWVVVAALAGQASVAGSEGCDGPATGCECPGCDAYFRALEEGAPAIEGMPSPEGMPGAEPFADALPDISADTSLLAASFGAPAGAAGAVPSMIGDFFGNGYRYAFTGPFNDDDFGTTVAAAGGDRRFKYAENTNPIPTDRVFFNYHLFNNPLTDVDGSSRDLNRFTFGVEKTFCDQLASIEFRVPFASALDSRQELIGSGGTAAEFGNMALAAKVLLHRSERSAVAAGLGIVFPTGDDSVVTNQGETLIRFENGSLFLQPFVGVYQAPNERLFHQFLFQLDFDVTGSDVVIPGPSFVTPLFGPREESRLQSQTLMYLDYQVGYWLCRHRCDRLLSGLAPLVELHYTTTLQDQDYGSFVGRRIFVEDFRRDVLNLTAGLYMELCQHTSLKVAAVAPLLNDRVFDSELGVQVVHRY